MADFAAPTKAEVKAVYVVEQYTLPAGEAIDAGEICGIDTAGKAVLADADTGPIYAKGIAVTGANQAGIPITIVSKGLVDVGDIFTGTTPATDVFYSGTPGLMADAAVGGLAAIGEVWPAWGYTSVDMLFRINL